MSAVVDGVWVQSSVSQLKTAAACLLKWYFDKRQGLPKKPPSRGIQIGKEGHRELEFYLKGEGAVLGPLARAGLKYLPTPVHGLMIERRFDGKKQGELFDPKTAVLFAGGVPLDGYIDVVNGNALLRSYEMPGTGVRLEKGTLIVKDHKFSKLIEDRDSGGYAALPEDLADVRFEHGIQMIGYGEWARLALLPKVNFDRVLLQHIYYNNGLKRATPAARTVWTTVDLETVQREWFKVNSLARSVVDVAKETDVLKVPYNEASCEAYGGCDFANVCPRSPLNRYLYQDLNPETPQDSMSIVNALLAQQQLTPAAPQQILPLPPAPAPVIAPQAPVAAPGWTTANLAQPGQVYFIQALGKAVAFLGNGPDGTPFFEHNGAPIPMHATTQVFHMAPAPVAPLAAPGTATVGLDSAGRPMAAVLPPDAPVSSPLTSAEPTKVEAAAEEKPKKAKKAKGFTIIDETTSPDVPMGAVVGEAATVTIPAGGTASLRPAGSTEPIAVQAGTSPATITVNPEPVAGPAAVKLYIGCRPDAGSLRLDDYVTELVAKLCAHYKVKDPRITPVDQTGSKDRNHPLAFDGWKGRLSAVVAAQLPPAGSYHFIGRSDFADIIVPALAALLPAENVVRAG